MEISNPIQLNAIILQNDHSIPNNNSNSLPISDCGTFFAFSPRQDSMNLIAIENVTLVAFNENCTQFQFHPFHIRQIKTVISSDVVNVFLRVFFSIGFTYIEINEKWRSLEREAVLSLRHISYETQDLKKMARKLR